MPRFYKKVRGRADYQRSLDLLARVKKTAPQLTTKSGLMLGLGETRGELLETLADLRGVAVRHAHPGPILDADPETRSRRTLFTS